MSDEQSLEQTIAHTPIISISQLDSKIREKLELPALETTHADPQQTIEELYSKVEEHKQAIQDTPVQAQDPNKALLAVYKTIDSIFSTDKTRTYLKKVQSAQDFQEQQLQQEQSQETYKLLTDFRRAASLAANDYRNAVDTITQYINHAQTLRDTQIPQLINEQEERITKAKEKLATLQDIQTSKEHADNQVVAANFYKNIHTVADNLKDTLRDAIATKEFLVDYNNTHVPKRLDLANRVREEAVANIPHLKEITAEVDMAIATYNGLTKPAQQISLALHTFETLSDLKDQAAIEHEQAAKNAIYQGQVFALNHADKKELRGE